MNINALSGDVDLDEYQKQAFAMLQERASELQKPIKKSFLFRKTVMPKGLYMWGGVGRGKTMLMDLFCESLPETVVARRIHFHEFMIEVHNYMHRQRQKKDGNVDILGFAKDIAQETRVLCFDEFHVTDITDAMILGRLFTELFKRDCVVIATSNWPPDRLYENGLQRELFLPFIALLKNNVQVFELAGEQDYRLLTLRDTGVYFYPLGAKAQQQADDVFARLTDSAEIYDETLSVKGRHITVPAVAKGVARFSFAALCEQPLGAEDYLTIAGAYHTVFLEGIPKIGYDRRNEAKRLMTLIDTLYDTGTKLVVTADSTIENLYRGHDYAFEFERTVSRLIEMQSREYLEKHRS